MELKLVKLYYKPHKSRKREAEFVDALIAKYNITDITTAYYPMPEYLASRSVETAEVINWVEHSGLSQLKLSAALLELQKLPPQVKVITNIKQITCDIVIVDSDTPYFIEFHEDQHRKLSIKQPRHVFSIDDEKIITPRFVQRLLRDIWRIKHLEPLTVVWADWFGKNGLDGVESLSQGYNEYHLPNSFNFKEFG